jgi:hypothetical protein
MSGIVLELQREALNNKCDILSLLRKAYLIAKKLKLSEFEEWINNELNGYTDGKTIPEYRKVHGELKAWNPYHGWVPVILTDDRLNALLTYQKIRMSISSLKNIYDNSDNNTFKIQFNGSINQNLSELCDFETKFALILGSNQIYCMIECIRNIILDWSIKLETSGIIGEGLQFSNEEKEIATNTPIINNYINNFYGDVRETQIQQNTDDSVQNQN